MIIGQVGQSKQRSPGDRHRYYSEDPALPRNVAPATGPAGKVICYLGNLGLGLAQVGKVTPVVAREQRRGNRRRLPSL